MSNNVADPAAAAPAEDVTPPADGGLGLDDEDIWGGDDGMAADIENKTIQFDRHFYLTGGYTFEINEDFDVEPMFLMKAVKAAPVQFDLSARAIYQEKYWLGATYRTMDALSVLLGMRLNNNFNLAYSYDITTSAVRQVSSGSHEITIGYDIRWHKEEFYHKFDY